MIARTQIKKVARTRSLPIELPFAEAAKIYAYRLAILLAVVLANLFLLILLILVSRVGLWVLLPVFVLLALGVSIRQKITERQEIIRLQKQAAQHRRNIFTLEERLADYYGLDHPLDLLNELEFAQEQLRQVEEQLAELKAQEGSPERIQRLYEQGINALITGKWEKAIISFQQVVEIDPHYKDAVFRLEEAKRQRERDRLTALVTIAGGIGVLVACAACTVLNIWLIPNMRESLVTWLFGPTATPTNTPTKTPTTATDTPMLTPMPSPTPTITPTPTPYYVEIVVDASERMSDEFEGGTTKMESAWQTARNIARIRAQQGQFVTVRLFGGQDSPGGGSCLTSYSLFDFTNDRRQVIDHLAESPTPGGEAAVVTALLDASDELQAHKNIGREIILLTGGEDGCGSTLSVFYSSDNQGLWTQTFVVLFSDQDFGPFTTLEIQGANIYYDLVRDRAEAEAVAEEIAVAAVSVAMGPTPTTPPPTSVAPDTPPPTSTPKPPPPTPFEGVATATRTPMPIATPVSTPTSTATSTSPPPPTDTPIAILTPTPPVPVISIIKPTQKAPCPLADECVFPVVGTSTNVAASSQTIVIFIDPGGGNWWPQNLDFPPPTIQASGDWEGKAKIGVGPQPSGTEFRLTTLLMDKTQVPTTKQPYTTLPPSIAAFGPIRIVCDTCFYANIVSPQGTHNREDASSFPVSNTVEISWEPSDCVMIVQYYQNNKLKGEQKSVTSGAEINVGAPGSGETEIKIWREGFEDQSDNIWVWVVD